VRHLLVPDLAGWHRSRMPEIPDVVTVRLAPDWVLLELEGKRYRVVQTAADAKRGKFPPFTHAIDVAKLWQR